MNADAEEMIDVLDERAQPTSQVVGKREVHQRELWHSGTHIWIYNSKGEVLLQLRDPNKDIYPNTWDISAAGHRSAGETPEQAALRETKEELGLTLQAQELRFVGVTRSDKLIENLNLVHHVFDWNYLLKRDVATADLTLQPGETVDARWCPLDEFEADVHDPERAKKYSPRPTYFYDLAIFEIRKALAEEKEGRP